MAKEEKSVPHVITGNVPYFGEDSVLHLPGEVVTALKSEAGENLAPASKEDAAAYVEVAPVAPTGGGPNPQGLPPGTRESGTGAQVSPGTPGTEGQAQTFGVPDGPDPEKK